MSWAGQDLTERGVGARVSATGGGAPHSHAPALLKALKTSVSQLYLSLSFNFTVSTQGHTSSFGAVARRDAATATPSDRHIYPSKRTWLPAFLHPLALAPFRSCH